MPEARDAILLEVNTIKTIYNHVILVLKGVSLSLRRSGKTALVGGNGAGKTTTLTAVSNRLSSQRGEVTTGMILYRHERVQELSQAEMVRRGGNQVMEGRHCFEHLTAEENLLTRSPRDRARVCRATRGRRKRKTAILALFLREPTC